MESFPKTGILDYSKATNINCIDNSLLEKLPKFGKRVFKKLTKIEKENENLVSKLKISCDVCGDLQAKSSCL